MNMDPCKHTTGVDHCGASGAVDAETDGEAGSESELRQVSQGQARIKLQLQTYTA